MPVSKMYLPGFFKSGPNQHNEILRNGTINNGKSSGIFMRRRNDMNCAVAQRRRNGGEAKREKVV
ncbi:unnamed protein product [Arabidopsis thaliana]|jgi:hypothetical protein|uniref:Uncharacterized protein n=4 Tax=Arabidopsis TaxID=3701 RepID=A0A654FY41_ARATH|nr:uncharacterized protein AT5G04238 [Arabidopsis thaliana]KAG7601120.1 hypothetical protein ISN45_At05g003360 [Arabidopsis thaliana x Arabidopsis arenosa]KAG7608063.1 hypothetical protein ISN44_As05g003400 [Arabidopsis suecica]AED90716.1 hypothetical protein AT5G04238 [Arabidopsis thaliana]CAA0400569.1 unnamed protein product [Arabidopsis thaliana]VYS65821.1 unnamed protein product [Arabidopsis thaliana]|eukprot:NP_001119167.1 hypothetical protein AT5G04238 [Arabidopsis thaliana]